jgi:hypothetical protein
VSATVSAPTRAGPVYVDPIVDPEDPVLKSIRSVLEAERTINDRGALFQKRLAQLGGGTVEKLFAAEALASEGPFGPKEEAQIGEALPRAFDQEKDDYVKISLGSWLWDLVYPRTEGPGRVNTLNATIQAARSLSDSVRTFALDRLAEADPIRLREPGVKVAPEVVRLLEDRRTKEQDAGVRRHLEDILTALRR